MAVLSEKSRIAFHARMSFMAITVQKSGLRGHFVFSSVHRHPRFLRIDMISRWNHVHHFRITNPEDIDTVFASWVADAYRVGEQRHLGSSVVAFERMTAVRASVFIATSLDGYIARADGGLDWLPAAGAVSENIDNGYREFMASVDTCVMGRHTFEKVLTLGPWPYAGKRTIVLTGRSAGLSAPPSAEVEFMGGAPREIVRRLGERGARHLYVDGGNTIRRFLEAGLIQRFVITRIPVILGAGIPLFGPVGRDIHLDHVATRSYPSGFVQSEYVVVS